MAQIVYISFTEDRRAAIPAASRMIAVDCTVESPRIVIRRLFWLLPLIPVFLVLAFCLCVLRRNHG